MAVLEVQNIKKRFGSTDVLKGVSFSLEKGQVLAIIGSSGSGKTTLLRCLNFLEKPDSGDICIEGRSLLEGMQTESRIRENRLHFGLVFQNFNLFPQYSVLKNVTLAPDLQRPDKKKENKEEDKSVKFHRREFNYTRFEQTLLLPENVDKEKITAKACSGVLCITLPKMATLPDKQSSRVINVQ